MNKNILKTNNLRFESQINLICNEIDMKVKELYKIGSEIAYLNRENKDSEKIDKLFEKMSLIINSMGRAKAIVSNEHPKLAKFINVISQINEKEGV